MIQKIEVSEAQNTVLNNSTPVSNVTSFDYFISYAHVYGKEVLEFVTELKNANKDLSIFTAATVLRPAVYGSKIFQMPFKTLNRLSVFYRGSTAHQMFAGMSFRAPS